MLSYLRSLEHTHDSPISAALIIGCQELNGEIDAKNQECVECTYSQN